MKYLSMPLWTLDVLYISARQQPSTTVHVFTACLWLLQLQPTPPASYMCICLIWEHLCLGLCPFGSVFTLGLGHAGMGRPIWISLWGRTCDLPRTPLSLVSGTVSATELIQCSVSGEERELLYAAIATNKGMESQPNGFGSCCLVGLRQRL